MTNRAIIGLGVVLVSSAVAACQTHPTLASPNQKSSENCAIYATIAKAELQFKNGTIELPTPLNVSCDWERYGIRFALSQKEPSDAFAPWLAFGSVAKTGERSVTARISYGYAPTFAREADCDLVKSGVTWRFVKCHYLAVS